MEEVQKFRAEVRQWLADNLVGEFAALKGLGGPGREHEAFEERRAWNQHLAEAGLTCLGWPVEHGGRGLSTAHRVAFYEEYALADAPDKVNHFGEELLGPTLIAFGTPEQQQQIMPKEVPDTLQLYLDGKIEQFWFRQDRPGVIFLMNVASVDEAKTAVSELPLSEGGFMTFELTPVGPLAPLARLIQKQA